MQHAHDTEMVSPLPCRRATGGSTLAPHTSPPRTPAETEAAIETLRRPRMTGPQIAEKLSMPLFAVTSVLKRLGLNRLSKLEPPEPPTGIAGATPAN